MGSERAAKQAKLRMLRRKRQQTNDEPEANVPAATKYEHADILNLQQLVGNRGVQQMIAQRYPAMVQRDPQDRKPKINYAKAERANRAYSQLDNLGWVEKLKTVDGGKFKSWAEMWEKGQFNEFADAVQQYQMDNDLPKPYDGILGLQTWAKIGGAGEAMAGIGDVQFPKSEKLCFEASRERIERGQRLTTGKGLKLPAGAKKSTYEIILGVRALQMDEIDEQYRGAGAAGALVYSGLGDFVSEDDIKKGKLKPGAVIQVWGSKDAYDLLKSADDDAIKKVKNPKSFFYGTSMVFVRYEGTNNDTLVTRHFGGTETHPLSDFAVWVVANVK